MNYPPSEKMHQQRDRIERATRDIVSEHLDADLNSEDDREALVRDIIGEFHRSNCCKAPMVNGGVQCEACGSNGE